MARLTEHQLHALDAYGALIAQRPSLFAGRHSRPIVQDREALAAYAGDHGVVLGVAAETPFVLFIVDLVESRSTDGRVSRHPYLRVVSRGQLEGGVNVVVLATIEDLSLGRSGDVVLVEQDRHALGTSEIELPRGFGEHSLSGEANALRELREETGYVGDGARLLGSTYPDSGLTDGMVSFYHVPVVRRTARRPELEESIARVRLATRDEVWEGIRSGAIRDGFTLQALALYEKACLSGVS
jgi:ADP-ribose pyrophosphatase